MRVAMGSISKLLFCFSLLLIVGTTTGIESISTTQPIRDGDTIISANGTYRLGFFSPGKTRYRYLGIWFGKSVPRSVWVANRDTPLYDSSGVLRLTSQGKLVLLNSSGSTIWSSSLSRPAKNPIAQLLDSGNLVVKEEVDDNLENSLWQSFQHPCDTLLPDMKLGWNRKTGMEWALTSWKSPDDPSRSNLTFVISSSGYPESIVMEGSKVRHRCGPWNGLRFGGSMESKNNLNYYDQLVSNENETYFSYHLLNTSMLGSLVLNPVGDIQSFMWFDRTQSWRSLTLNNDKCERYAMCGANGICSIADSPMCNCLYGFVPKNPSDWEVMDWSSGCVRRTSLNCSVDGFRKLSGVKLPQTATSWFNKSINLEECKKICLKNCSCTAYSNMDIRDGGSGCLLWFAYLIDSRVYNQNGQDIYIRLAVSELAEGEGHGSDTKAKSHAKKRIIVSCVSSTGIFLLCLALFFYLRKIKQQRNDNKGGKEDLDLPLFDLGTLACATNNFSLDNKLGQGGFGPVYKGTLNDGRQIAVKRLSKNSRQGLDEFRNEVKHIVKLQHRNLVKLLGCCTAEDEKMLVYEFLPNKSLDFFIFDKTRSLILDWPRRYNIINGIARGLLYLHQDSRLRIIHRDLKASNILLDYEMNPKISDFGLARSFGGNKSEANTNKVAGTYGYISPEYATKGLYSPKSDVFSFGVLMLEIVHGNMNRGFCHPDHHFNLTGHAWKLFKEGRPEELIAKSVTETCNLFEVLRLIHVGLLCVQENPIDRPCMSSVVLMLGNDDALPQPKQPGFFTERDMIEVTCSTNECSMSLFEAR